jgi:hypothetical protein
VPQSYVCHASKVAPNKFDGGSTTVIDHRQFPGTSLSALIIDLEPGALRDDPSTRAKNKARRLLRRPRYATERAASMRAKRALMGLSLIPTVSCNAC